MLFLQLVQVFVFILYRQNIICVKSVVFILVKQFWEGRVGRKMGFFHFNLAQFLFRGQDLRIYNQQSLIASLCLMQDKESQFQKMTVQSLNQEVLHPCDSTNDEAELPIDPIFVDPQISTRLIALASSSLQLRPAYRLHSKILTHTSITQNMRARLRSFLMTETSKQCLLRQTCVLACTLVDLYFGHHGLVEVSQFQNLVIGCLILAAKLKEGKFPMISYNIFSRQQLLTYQKKVAKKLNYSLMPHTYYDYAQKVIYLWDCFTQEEGVFHSKLGQCQTGINACLRKFYEQLDCIFMVLKSLDYDLQQLVLNHFYLHAATINIQLPSSPSHLTEQQFQSTFYSQQHSFTQFYKRFLKFYSTKDLTLNIEMGCYLRYFLGVISTQKEWGIKGNALALQKIRKWDMIQTVPKDNYPLAKSVIERINKTSKK